MTDDKTIVLEGTVRVLWCLDHETYAVVGKHDDCATEWREVGEDSTP